MNEDPENGQKWIDAFAACANVLLEAGLEHETIVLPKLRRIVIALNLEAPQSAPADLQGALLFFRTLFGRTSERFLTASPEQQNDCKYLHARNRDLSDAVREKLGMSPLVRGVLRRNEAA